MYLVLVIARISRHPRASGRRPPAGSPPPRRKSRKRCALSDLRCSVPPV